MGQRHSPKRVGATKTSGRWAILKASAALTIATSAQPRTPRLTPVRVSV